jgi:hypothetical protein
MYSSHHIIRIAELYISYRVPLNFAIFRTVSYVPYCEIWKGQKFVGCANAIYNIAKL